MSDPAASGPVVVIRAAHTRSLWTPMREVVDNWRLLLTLSHREIVVRNRQTVLGGLWYLVQPLVSGGLFSLVFGVIIGIPGDGVPYPLFVTSGVAFWQYFARTAGTGVGSLVGAGPFITKLYVPKAIFPAAGAVYNLVDTGIFLAFVLVLMGFYGVVPGIRILLVPVALAMLGLIALGLALVLAPLNVAYRDVGFAMGTVLQILLFLTPIVYPPSMIPGALGWLAYVNPLAPIIQLGRWSLVGGAFPPGLALMAAGLWIVVLLAVGSFVFLWLEPETVEKI